MKLPQSPSQTVGPYFAYGLTPEQYNYDFKALAGADMIGRDEQHTILISGNIYDGKGQAISDAMVELWQNDGKTKLFGRCGTGTDPEHKFIFRTLKPECVEGKAPYISVIVFMRGQLIHSYTRIYFPEDAALHQNDALLTSIPAERRTTLLARKTANGYEFNIHMQGENETVFFAISSEE